MGRERADGRYVFGRIDQRTGVADGAPQLHGHAEPVGAGLRAAVRLGGRLLASSRSSWTAARATTSGSLRAIDYFGNPDFNYRSFRTTNVLRWEYRPGSTLFVVWQQGREDVFDRGTFDFRSDVSSVFGAPARNVFLVKWATG